VMLLNGSPLSPFFFKMGSIAPASVSGRGPFLCSRTTVFTVTHNFICIRVWMIRTRACLLDFRRQLRQYSGSSLVERLCSRFLSSLADSCMPIYDCICLCSRTLPLQRWMNNHLQLFLLFRGSINA
jgi:hypothetical protein